jgi:hypothetical protein
MNQSKFNITVSPKYGYMNEIVSETKAAEIREKMNASITEEKKRKTDAHRRYEDHKIAKEMGITVEELNSGGVWENE